MSNSKDRRNFANFNANMAHFRWDRRLFQKGYEGGHTRHELYDFK